MDTIKASECTMAFAEPGAHNLIDLINPITNRSAINGESLEEIRKRYPTAEIVNVEEWCKAKAARQDTPIEWHDTTKEKYWEMLEVLPPAFMQGNYFLVGEPCDHHAITGRSRYQAFGQIGERYIVASRPMTVLELKALLI